MRANPVVFETNARLFIRRLTERYGQPLTLAAVPDTEWERLADMGFDAVWLMGVWQRSEAARSEALRHHGLREEYGRALPDWTEDDVQGSPYAVSSYELDPNLGRPDDLAVVKERVNAAGLKLLLDFVPNHLARDHRWTIAHPERLVRLSAEHATAHPDWAFAGADGTLFAHGRDPYYGPWTDTVQLDFFHPDTRAALIDELLGIAALADGVRCDMAMLALNEVFAWIWGDFVEQSDTEGEFWSEAIAAVKARHPAFVFVAEAYWGHEPALQRLGFDYVYDKTVYDLLQRDHADAVRAHIAAQERPERWARFIENHDEVRAAQAFEAKRGRAAAVVIATLPGLRLFHDGQLEGRRARLPVQLVREPREEPDESLRAFYQRLLAATAADIFHDGEWKQMAFPEGPTGEHVLGWEWRLNGRLRLALINYSPYQVHSSVAPPDGITRWWDLLSEPISAFDAEGGTMELELAPWRAMLLSSEGPGR